MSDVHAKGGGSPHANAKYRPDVDGLRAVAILSVVAFHAFPQWIRGGFVGVDVFFVISGFLITSVIVGNLQAGNFSFLVFYQHRIRRIFPALVLVLAGCALAGWYLLSAGDYAQLGRHIASGAGFVSNFVLWNEAGYFDSSSDLKPLLHLWSLGIEEQFYFVWPLILWFAWGRRWNILVVTTLVLLASFAANIVMVQASAVTNFYWPTTRIWELLIGAVLVGIKAPGNAPLQFRARHSNCAAVVGLIAIVGSECLLTKDSTFPGWWALLPTVGAALIIVAGPAAWVNSRLLSNPLMVWIGLISYPLYLWHWPILAFLRITDALKDRVAVGVCAVTAAFALSWLTYRFIERPLRTGWFPAARTTVAKDRFALNLKAAALVLFMTLAGVAGGLIYRTDGTLYGAGTKIASLPPLPDKSVFEELKIYEHYDRPNNSCRDNLKMDPFREEVCVSNSSAPKVLFLGDSHAMGLYSAIFANRVAVPSVLIASPGCLTYSNLVFKPKGREWGQDCTKIAEKGLEYARRSTHIDTVVVSLVRKGDNPASLTNFYSGDRQLTEFEALNAGTDHLIGSLLESGKTVIYVVDVPYFPNTPENCQSKSIVSKTDPCVIDRSEANKPFKPYFDALARVKAKYPGVKIFNAENVLCKDRVCVQHDEKQYYYIDKDHLSVYGSETVLAGLFAQFPMN